MTGQMFMSETFPKREGIMAAIDLQCTLEVTGTVSKGIDSCSLKRHPRDKDETKKL